MQGLECSQYSNWSIPEPKVFITHLLGAGGGRKRDTAVDGEGLRLYLSSLGASSLGGMGGRLCTVTEIAPSSWSTARIQSVVSMLIMSTLMAHPCSTPFVA